MIFKSCTQRHSEWLSKYGLQCYPKYTAVGSTLKYEHSAPVAPYNENDWNEEGHRETSSCTGSTKKFSNIMTWSGRAHAQLAPTRQLWKPMPVSMCTGVLLAQIPKIYPHIDLISITTPTIPPKSIPIWLHLTAFRLIGNQNPCVRNPIGRLIIVIRTVILQICARTSRTGFPE